MSEEKIIKNEDVKKEVKKVVKSEDVKKEFVKASEMKIEDLSKLKQATITIIKVINKKKNSVNYKLTVLLDNDLEFEKYITKNEYILTCFKRKLDQNILLHSFRAPIRFIKGHYRNVDDYWIRYEVFIVGGFVLSGFLTSREKYLVSLLDEDKLFTYDIYLSQEIVEANLDDVIVDDVYMM